MKFGRQYTKDEATDIVEVNVIALDRNGGRISSRMVSGKMWRDTLRLEETSVPEVYEIIVKALEQFIKGG